jgi:hypothetical protein
MKLLKYLRGRPDNESKITYTMLKNSCYSFGGDFIMSQNNSELFFLSRGHHNSDACKPWSPAAKAWISEETRSEFCQEQWLLLKNSRDPTFVFLSLQGNILYFFHKTTSCQLLFFEAHGSEWMIFRKYECTFFIPVFHLKFVGGSNFFHDSNVRNLWNWNIHQNLKSKPEKN